MRRRWTRCRNLSTFIIPVHGKLTGQFHGRGTRREPNINGLFDLADGEVYGVLFNRLRGQLTVTRDEVAHRQCRTAPVPARERSGPRSGHRHGNGGIPDADKNISVDLGRRVYSAFEFCEFADGAIPRGRAGFIPRQSHGPRDCAGSRRNVPRGRFARGASGDRQLRGQPEFGWQAREIDAELVDEQRRRIVGRDQPRIVGSLSISTEKSRSRISISIRFLRARCTSINSRATGARKARSRSTARLRHPKSIIVDAQVFASAVQLRQRATRKRRADSFPFVATTISKLFRRDSKARTRT